MSVEPPPTPLTVIVYTPAGTVANVLIVILESKSGGISSGTNVAVIPPKGSGTMLSINKSTILSGPAILCTFTNVSTLLPLTTVSVFGFATIINVIDGFTVKSYVAVLVSAPPQLSPLTVIV